MEIYWTETPAFSSRLTTSSNYACFPLSGRTSLPRAFRQTCKARLSAASLWPADSAGCKDPAASDAHCLLVAQRSESAHLHRLLVFTSVFQPQSETRPNCIDSIPHSRHARPSGVRACRAFGIAHTQPWAGEQGRSHGSIPSARGEEWRADQWSVQFVDPGGTISCLSCLLLGTRQKPRSPTCIVPICCLTMELGWGGEKGKEREKKTLHNLVHS